MKLCVVIPSSEQDAANTVLGEPSFAVQVNKEWNGEHYGYIAQWSGIDDPASVTSVLDVAGVEYQSFTGYTSVWGDEDTSVVKLHDPNIARVEAEGV
jgi:hypothetical protein